MRRYIEQSNALAPSSRFQSWLDRTINTSGYDFQKGQGCFKSFRLRKLEQGLIRRTSFRQCRQERFMKSLRFLDLRRMA
jgi:hypothetical protein